MPHLPIGIFMKRVSEHHKNDTYDLKICDPFKKPTVTTACIFHRIAHLSHKDINQLKKTNTAISTDKCKINTSFPTIQPVRPQTLNPNKHFLCFVIYY